MNTCHRFNSYGENATYIFKIDNKYEGIPDNFLINIVIFFSMVVLFAILRKLAWNYGNLAWYHKPIDTLNVIPDYNLAKYSSMDNITPFASDVILTDTDKTKSKYTFKWFKIPLFITISDEMIKKRWGQDAVIYCMFQRMVILITIVMTIVSLTIILPVNLTGNLLSNDSSQFSTLTIANINSNYLIIHVVSAFLLMIFVFILSFIFVKYVDKEIDEKLSKTIMITNVPSNEVSTVNLIEQHFKEAYPSVTVINVQQTYEIQTLLQLYTEKVAAEEALQYCLEVWEKDNIHVHVNTSTCSRVFKYCTNCKREKIKEIDGITFYKEEFERLLNLFLIEKENAMKSKILPIYFVTFQNLKEALFVRKEYKYQNYLCFNNIKRSHSSVSEELKTYNWHVTFANKATDMLWKNLHKKGWRLWLVIILINAGIAIFVIFLSTPYIVLQILNSFEIGSKVPKSASAFGSRFIPPFLMVVVGALIPVVVVMANEYSAYWTKTKESIAIMNKLFAVLITTILILPSLGLPSIDFVFKSFQNGTWNIFNAQINCIFLPDGGAIFCNYLISAAFTGIGLELLRLGVLFTYAFKIFFSKSRAEFDTIVKSLLYEFPYGINYAWTLSLFCIVSTYAFIVPLVTPFGLTYLVLKYFVDRYNMIHSNVPTDIHNDVHANAAQLMQICLLFTQFTTTAYVVTRRVKMDNIGICGIFAFVIGIALTVSSSIRRLILKMAWMKYYNKTGNIGETNNLKKSQVKMTNLNSNFSPEIITIDENTNLKERIERHLSISGDENSRISDSKN